MFYYFLVALWVAFIFRVMIVKGKIDNQALGGTGVPMTEVLEKEWSDLSRNGQNPWRVIRLGSEMAAHMNNVFMQQKHLTSCFYSQIKHLLKKGYLPTAIAFFWEAKA